MFPIIGFFPPKLRGIRGAGEPTCRSEERSREGKTRGCRRRNARRGASLGARGTRPPGRINGSAAGRTPGPGTSPNGAAARALGGRPAAYFLGFFLSARSEAAGEAFIGFAATLFRAGRSVPAEVRVVFRVDDFVDIVSLLFYLQRKYRFTLLEEV